MSLSHRNQRKIANHVLEPFSQRAPYDADDIERIKHEHSSTKATLEGLAKKEDLTFLVKGLFKKSNEDLMQAFVRTIELLFLRMHNQLNMMTKLFIQNQEQKLAEHLAEVATLMKTGSEIYQKIETQFKEKYRFEGWSAQGRQFKDAITEVNNLCQQKPADLEQLAGALDEEEEERSSFSDSDEDQAMATGSNSTTPLRKPQTPDSSLSSLSIERLSSSESGGPESPASMRDEARGSITPTNANSNHSYAAIQRRLSFSVSSNRSSVSATDSVAALLPELPEIGLGEDNTLYKEKNRIFLDFDLYQPNHELNASVAGKRPRTMSMVLQGEESKASPQDGVEKRRKRRGSAPAAGPIDRQLPSSHQYRSGAISMIDFFGERKPSSQSKRRNSAPAAFDCVTRRDEDLELASVSSDSSASSMGMKR